MLHAEHEHEHEHEHKHVVTNTTANHHPLGPTPCKFAQAPTKQQAASATAAGPGGTAVLPRPAVPAQRTDCMAAVSGLPGACTTLCTCCYACHQQRCCCCRQGPSMVSNINLSILLAPQACPGPAHAQSGSEARCVEQTTLLFSVPEPYLRLYSSALAVQRLPLRLRAAM